MARPSDFFHCESLQGCVDELTELMTEMVHYHPTVLAAALSVHLEILLHALLQGGVCTRSEVRDFVKELERDALREVTRPSTIG